MNKINLSDINLTKYKDNKINGYIVMQLSMILEEIRYKIKYNLKSIILLGGFGRGEGSVLIESGRVIPLNDYDILLVTDNLIPPYKLTTILSKELQKKLGIHLDIQIKKYSSIPLLPPLIMNYEIKYGSKVIWGEDVLKKIPNYKPTEIPLWDGVSLLFNRMNSLIYGWPLANDNKRFVIGQSIKGLHACCESLLLLSGDYHYSYEERNKRFKEIFPKKYPALYEKIPELLDYVDKAIIFKLKPDYSAFPKPDELWDKVVDMYFKVFSYYLGTYYQTDSRDMTKIIEKFNEMQKEPSYRTSALWLLYMYQMYNHGFKVIKFNFRLHPNNFIYSLEPFLLKALRDYPNHSNLDVKIAKEFLNNVIDMKDDEDIFAIRKKCILAFGRGEYE